MLSRPIASGAMLAVLLAALGLAVLQPAEGEQPIDVEIAELPDSEEPAEETAEAERPATPADRVVDEAGFPAVPEESTEEDEAPAPTVTVNGRPLSVRTANTQETGTERASAESAEAEADDEASETSEEQDKPLLATEAEGTRVAVVEPPMPRPRPDDLPVKRAESEIDYDAIAEAAYGEGDDEFMSLDERRALAPMPGQPGNGGAVEAFDPRAEGLVEMVGPSGERIWVYPEQLESGRSGVTFQEGRAGNEYGFVYEDAAPLW